MTHIGSKTNRFFTVRNCCNVTDEILLPSLVIFTNGLHNTYHLCKPSWLMLLFSRLFSVVDHHPYCFFFTQSALLTHWRRLEFHKDLATKRKIMWRSFFVSLSIWKPSNNKTMQCSRPTNSGVLVFLIIFITVWHRGKAIFLLLFKWKFRPF